MPRRRRLRDVRDAAQQHPATCPARGAGDRPHHNRAAAAGEDSPTASLASARTLTCVRSPQPTLSRSLATFTNSVPVRVPRCPRPPRSTGCASTSPNVSAIWSSSRRTTSATTTVSTVASQTARCPIRGDVFQQAIEYEIGRLPEQEQILRQIAANAQPAGAAGPQTPAEVQWLVAHLVSTATTRPCAG